MAEHEGGRRTEGKGMNVQHRTSNAQHRMKNKRNKRQRTEVGGQRSEDGGRRTEVRAQRTDDAPVKSPAGNSAGVISRGKEFENLRFHSTFDIIRAVEGGDLPDRIMITIHPQRWTDNPVEWTKELVWQNFKNVFKKLLIGLRPQ